MPLVQPNSAAITAAIADTLQSDGSLAEALDTNILWALNKASLEPVGPTVIYALSSGSLPGNPGRWRAKTAGAVALDYPSRYDLSVNHARVESAASSSPVMVTGTTLNTAGAYTGGGTGNKSILGFKGHSGMLLSALASLSWEWDTVALPDTVPAPVLVYPYVNLVVQLDATPNYKILVIDPNQNASTPALNLGALAATGPTSWKFTHVATADFNFVQVVNAFTPQVAAGIVPAMPIVCTPPLMVVPVPTAAGVPVPPVAVPIWNNYSFRYSQILAAPGWAGATLIDIYTGDGGLPGPAGTNTPTPSMFLCVGDSEFRKQRYIRMGPILLNGSPA